MITSAANAGWPDDVSLERRYQECNLPVPCVIRTAKIATVNLMSAVRIGRAPPDIIAEVQARLKRHLAL